MTYSRIHERGRKGITNKYTVQDNRMLCSVHSITNIYSLRGTKLTKIWDN